MPYPSRIVDPNDVSAIFKAFKSKFEMTGRSALIAKLFDLSLRSDLLARELFIADPDHKYFVDLTEAELAPLRIERINRISTGG